MAGVGVDGHGYVLEDLSGKHAPAKWARKAIAAYERHQADRIIAEINMGGLMVEQTIRMVDPNAPYRGVHAKRGKMILAEPVSALYEKSWVHHVGFFGELEDQLCTYSGGGDSPDRLDSLVYCLTDLLIMGNYEHQCFTLRMLKETTMTLNELLSSRDTAGARYAKAIAELHDALIDLAGIDKALQNANVGHGGRNELLTFFHPPQTLGTLAHPTFAPANTAVDWREEIHARRDEIIASIK